MLTAILRHLTQRRASNAARRLAREGQRKRHARVIAKTNELRAELNWPTL